VVDMSASSVGEEVEGERVLLDELQVIREFVENWFMGG